MKTVGIILVVCVLQIWAFPRLEEALAQSGALSKLEQLRAKIQTPRAPQTPEEIRAALHEDFTHFVEFYDSTNEAMRRYRLEHVTRIRENYQGFMREFGYAIEHLRARTGNQYPTNIAINACARRANATLVDALDTYFYPTFRQVQDRTTELPMYTLDALRRGNLFSDESDEIFGYLDIQYEAYLLMWLQTVSKFFRWEKNKTDVNGDFYQEEMNFCLCEVVPESLRCGQSPLPIKAIPIQAF